MGWIEALRTSDQWALVFNVEFAIADDEFEDYPIRIPGMDVEGVLLTV
jgi:hypothetical protein